VLSCTTKDQLGAVLKAPHFQFTARFELTYGGWPRSKTSHRLGAPRVDLHVGIFSSLWELTHNAVRLHKKSRLRGHNLRVAKVANADANQAKPLQRAEADTFPQ